MFVLAHLSDPHLAPMPHLRPLDLASKRLLGYANWRRRRHLVHRSEILARIVGDLAAQKPDHVAVTGDLVNISHPLEFKPSREWLSALGAPDHVTLVPGNHDIYVRDAVEYPRLHWGDYLRGDGGEAAAYPFVRRRGPLALIGVSSAVPMPPLMATGRVGAVQLARLGEVLARLHEEGAFRVVLIHHPPREKPTAFHKRLVDAGEVRAVLAKHGAELVIHGHDHIHSLQYLQGPAGKVPLVGVPSASAAPAAHDDPAAYNLYRIKGAPGAWDCTMVTRGLRREGGDVVALNEMPLGRSGR